MLKSLWKWCKSLKKSVITAIDLFENGINVKKPNFRMVRKTSITRRSGRLALELIARYQPVATDLRFIRSCMEIAYDFSRFGRYSYDIADVLETMGSISDCDKSYVLKMSNTVREMIHLSINALQSRDRNAAQKLYEMDDTVDALYRRYVNEIINPQENQNKKEFLDKTLRCYISALLILRYLERISDHACYIGDSVYYIVTGNSNPRR